MAPCFCPHHVPIQVFQDPFFRERGLHLGVSCLAAHRLCPQRLGSPSLAFQAIGAPGPEGRHRTPNLDQFCRLQEGRAPAEVLVAMPTHVSLAVVPRKA